MLPNLLSEIVFVVSKLKSTNGLNFSLTAGRSLGRIPDKHMTPPGFIKPQIGTTSRVKAPFVFWKKEKKRKKKKKRKNSIFEYILYKYKYNY